MKTLILCFGLSFVSAAVGSASDEQALRDLDAQWSAAAGAKDLEKTLSFYADDVTVLPPNAPALTTKDGVRKTFKQLFEMPGFALSWKATRVEMAKAGDMAYLIGTYEMTLNDVSGKPVKEHGKYLAVMEKKGGAEWKCGADMFSSDEPAPNQK